MQNINLYADDYSILLSNGESYINIFKAFFYKWSGRLIGHSIVVFGLNIFGIQFFRILNPIFLFLLCYYLAKIINIKRKYNQDILQLIIVIIVLSFSIFLTRETLYWAYGSILYIWSTLPLSIIIYYIYDYIIDNKTFNIKRFYISIIFSIIIGLTMESTLVLLIIFILLVIIRNIYSKQNNNKINILFILSILILITLIFIPGNQNRIISSENSFLNLNLINKIIYQLPHYFMRIFSKDIMGICLIVLSLFTTIKFKTNKNIFYIMIKIFLLASNIFLILDANKNIFYIMIKIFLLASNIFLILDINFFNNLIKEQTYNSIIIFLCSVYLIISLVIICIYLRKNYIYMFILIASIISITPSFILVDYYANRFLWLPILFSNLIILKIYLSEEIKDKLLILNLIGISYNILFSIVFIIFSISYLKLNNKKFYKIITISLIILNLSNFFNAIYYYNENDKIFDYNENIIKTREENKKDIIYYYNGNKKNNEKIIYLLKLKSPNYAFSMPENYLPWTEYYKKYYNIEDYHIIWLEEKLINFIYGGEV